MGTRGNALFREGTGGSEKQIALLARHLAGRGHRVTLLVTQHAGPDMQVDGVTLKAAWDPDRGIRRVRAVTYRYPALARALLRERADLYYVRDTTALAITVMHVARCLDSPGLLGLFSESGLSPKLAQTMLQQRGSSWSDRGIACATWFVLRRRALRLADVVVAQNTGQAEGCAAMGLPHVLIPSIVEEPADDLLSVESAYDVVWVGNAQSDTRGWVKGISALANLAARLPGVRFAVVGELTAGSVAADVTRLESCPNVELLGAQAYDEAQRSIARSRVVLNTSAFEGFSNVMLEGWALAKPALTLAVNPSGLLGEDGLGRCADGSLDRLASLVQESLADDAWLASTGQRAREYVRTAHGADTVCARYEQLAVGLP